MYEISTIRYSLYRKTNHVNDGILRFAIDERLMVQSSQLRVSIGERLRLFLETFMT